VRKFGRQTPGVGLSVERSKDRERGVRVNSLFSAYNAGEEVREFFNLKNTS